MLILLFLVSCTGRNRDVSCLSKLLAQLALKATLQLTYQSTKIITGASSNIHFPLSTSAGILLLTEIHMFYVPTLRVMLLIDNSKPGNTDNTHCIYLD